MPSGCDVRLRAGATVLVAGSTNGSNSNRLREVAEARGCACMTEDGPDDILRRQWLERRGNHRPHGWCSGARVLVQKVLA